MENKIPYICFQYNEYNVGLGVDYTQKPFKIDLLQSGDFLESDAVW